MKIIIQPPRSGKTAALIRMAAELDLLLVCANSATLRLAKTEAAALGLTIREPITWAQFRGRCRAGYNQAGVLIDDFHLILRDLCNGFAHVDAVAISSDVVGTEVPDEALVQLGADFVKEWSDGL